MENDNISRIEDKERLEVHRKRLTSFNKEIDKTFDKKLDSVLVEFLNKNTLKLKDDNIIQWLIKYNKFIKEYLK